MISDNLKISTAVPLTRSTVLVSAAILSMLAATPDYNELYKNIAPKTPCEISCSMDELSAVERLDEAKTNRLFANLFAKLDQYSELSQDWNGYDASPIPIDVIASAKQFLQNLLVNRFDLGGWEVFPTARESIQFEKTLNDTYAEVEVFSDGHFAFYSEGTEEIELDSINLLETMQRVSSVFA